MLIRVLLLPAVPVKPPAVHDDFSFLLLADTFCAGRLTNPTPPFWEHFETIHEFFRPTYSSMYPPGFSLFLALGQLFGNPWFGVLLTAGMMSAAICWMLQGWLPASWAFGGALLTIIQIGIGTFWMNNYIGGATVPALGGALLFGVLPRFMKKPNAKLVVLYSLGVILLINTRPFEGSVVSVICFGLAVLWGLRGSVRLRPAEAVSILRPALVVLVAGAGLTMYYQWRVTGNPLESSYVVNREIYGWPENLAILRPVKRTYRYKILERMEKVEFAHRAQYKTFGRMLNSWGARAAILWEFFVGPGLLLPLLALPWVMRNPRRRALLYVAIFMLAVNAFQLMAYPQHVSPEAAIYSLLLVCGLRVIYVFAARRGILPERIMAAIVVCVSYGALATLFIDQWNIWPRTFWESPRWLAYDQRAAVVSKLNSLPGKHLVFVRYSDDHSSHEEWVYNDADIEKSKIVWANMMGRKPDMALREHFHDRQAWVVAPDEDQTRGFLPLTSKTYEPETPVGCSSPEGPCE